MLLHQDVEYVHDIITFVVLDVVNGVSCSLMLLSEQCELFFNVVVNVGVCTSPMFLSRSVTDD